MSKINIGIVGATGYTGSELVRLLVEHPDVSIKIITSNSHKGKPFSKIHPHFQGIFDIELSAIEDLSEHDLDLVFLALPHGVSMDFVKDWNPEDYKVIDLSGDFRLPNADMYSQWYGKDHVAEARIDEAVYGLPELFRDKIRNALLVANPGCYPTSSILGLAPLFQNDLANTDNVVIDSKSGVTGAGAKAKKGTHFPDVFGNFSAYGLLNHRHTPEIQSTIKQFANSDINVLFTPHLLPIDRGILSTIYCKPTKAINKQMLDEIYNRFYHKEHFIRMVDSPPSVKHVRGSNYCDLYVNYDERTNHIVTISAIDNLVKGAAGQAVQNMNLMFGFLEHTGLKISPLNP